MKKLEIKVEEDLFPLLPEFIANRWEDNNTLRASLNCKNFEKIREIGHLLQGTPACFGYIYLAKIGKQLEKAAITKNRSLIAELIEKYEVFLKSHRAVCKSAKKVTKNN